ncbi:Retrovirus-related Pol polyprotein from transposon TNT 1-94 [Ceratobasidium sp. AG-Ba]|nr:Retrovirus-related Pol polyprotein from transposon TNT 1-94 [Ceratobasidium sp. AG-Ba]
MMFEANAPQFLWNEAVAYACYLKNRSPTQVKGVIQATPFQQFWGKLPNVSLLQPWGAKCYVLDQAEKRSKLDPKAFQAIFTGISDTQGKSWRYYKPGAMRILHSRNIAFLRQDDAPSGENEDEVLIPIAPPAEGEIVPENSSSSEQLKESEGTAGDLKVTNSEHIAHTESPTAHLLQVPIDSKRNIFSNLSTTLATESTHCSSTSQLPTSPATTAQSCMTSSTTAETDNPHPDPTHVPSDINPSFHTQTCSDNTGKSTLRLEPSVEPIDIILIDDNESKYGGIDNISSNESPDIEPPALYPLALTCTITSHEDTKYQTHQTKLDTSKTIKDKIAQLERTGTRKRTKIPAHKNLSNIYWVYELTHNRNGQITGYKARPIIKGYRQTPSQDFAPTFVPTNLESQY